MKVSMLLAKVDKEIHITLTRENKEKDEMVKKAILGGLSTLEGVNVKINHIPCIKHEPIDNPKLEDMIYSGNYGYVLVTSPEAARVVLNLGDGRVGGEQLRIAAVGAATAKTLEEGGLKVNFTPSKANGKTLGGELPALGEGMTTRVLYPASKQARNDVRDALNERGEGR